MTRKIFLTILLVLSCSNVVYALTESEAQSFARQAYTKALEAENSKDIELASMYFINALSLAPAFIPERIDVIQQYTSMIIKRVSEDSTLPADTLEALDSFLNAQIMTVLPDDLPKIIELRGKVSEAQEKLLSRNVPIVEAGNENIIEAEQFIKQYKAQALRSETLDQYIDNLQWAQELIEENNLNEPEISDNLQTALMMKALVDQINTLLSRAENDITMLQTYYLQLAENSFQQAIALSVKLPQKISNELLVLKSEIEGKINDVSDKRSEIAFRKIQREYENINGGRSNQAKIDKLNDFIQSITVLANEITSEKYNRELRKLMEEVQVKLLEYRTEQERQYNIWAIRQLYWMMKEVEKHDRTLYKAKLRDSKGMREVMVDRLSHIDTRLLNFGAQHVFSKVYEEYYGKLDAENQKKMDEAMAYNSKRSLTEF